VLEGWTVAAAVAGQTTAIRIGHLVLSAGFRPPALLGKMAATLDHVSDGRLDLGLGWGGALAELRGYGLGAGPGSQRRARLAETITIVRQVLAGEPLDFDGRHYTVHATPTGPSAVQPRVPLFIGGAGTETMRLVRQHADWWNCPSYGHDDLARLIPLSGRARVSANYSIAFSDSSPAPLRHFGDRCAPVIAGRPAAVADMLSADRDLGVELFNIQFVQAAQIVPHLARFMREVAPALR
jgi:alkanesulfonate monooxygenase SsuD/methylene tetrahydromethanopterin reductase-like flavin-dependent oxidoreductase (luciferase family)